MEPALLALAVFLHYILVKVNLRYLILLDRTSICPLQQVLEFRLLLFVYTVSAAYRFLIQQSTVKESVHMKIFGFTNRVQRILLIELTNRARIVAPRISNLGIDCFRTGAILVFDATILDST